MSRRSGVACLVLAVLGGIAISCAAASTAPAPVVERTVDTHAAGARTADGYDLAQVPRWTADDLDFFLHGSLGTEVLPEPVLAAFVATYPDLFPGGGVAAYGLIAPAGELPVGISRREVGHLGGLPSYGINCAACHVAEMTPSAGGPAVRVIGATSHFDAEAFLGAVTVAGFRTADAAQMAAFLRNYLRASDPSAGAAGQALLTTHLEAQRAAIGAAIAADPSGAAGVPRGALHEIGPADVAIDLPRLAAGMDLAALTRTMLRVFHNMRAALHIPDELPKTLPPASGPGRNDAFGLLAAALFGTPAEYAPVKYGLVWNTGGRPWVHWDGNTRSPLGRNVLAALGLGAPIVHDDGVRDDGVSDEGAAGTAVLDMAQVARHTDLTETIRPPAWPWAVDAAAAARGARHYETLCASCHDGPETDARLVDPAATGTDPSRARAFDGSRAERFNRFFREIRIDGFAAPAEPPIRSTGKYLSPTLDGVWARAPYLHNGSVRTMADLLTPSAARARSFRRGSRVYDTAALGYADDGPYVLDTSQPGNSGAGHEWGTELDPGAKRELIEFLKTR